MVSSFSVPFMAAMFLLVLLDPVFGATLIVKHLNLWLLNVLLASVLLLQKPLLTRSVISPHQRNQPLDGC